MLPAIEASIDKGLDTASQRVEEGGDRKGGDEYGELGLLLLAGECVEYRLGGGHTPKVEHRQHGGERAVDEGTVYEQVYLVEPIAKDGYPYGNRNGCTRGRENRQPGPREPRWCLYRQGNDVNDGAYCVYRSSVSEPFDLLALYPDCPAQPHKHR